MIIRNLQFFIFGDFKDIEAQGDKIIKIYTKLLENGITGIVPGTFQQVNPNLGLKAFERIVFTNTQEKYNIQIGMDSIQINKAIVDSKTYDITSESDLFLLKIKKIIKSIKEAEVGFQPGHRVSLLFDILHDKDKLKPMNDIYNILNNKIPNYGEEETFEWNTRGVKRTTVNILQEPEELNVVTEVLRVKGEVNAFGYINQFDTIQTKFDINTIDEKRNNRINEEFISDFLTYANDLFNSHYKDIEVKIVGTN